MNHALSVIIAVTAAVFSIAEAGGPPPVSGKWRITRIAGGPWAEPAVIAAFRPSDSLLGESVMFLRDEIVAPDPVGCARATYTAYDAPVREMFQGAELTENDVIALGVAGPTVPSFSVSCTLGLYEYHRVSEVSILVGIDNHVWTLDRTAGTRAPARSPEGVVQRFLERHFAGDMGFQRSAIEAKREFFSAALSEKMFAYINRNHGGEEPPSINGDPFTDSQDYPARFVVGPDLKEKSGAVVPVEFVDGLSTKKVRYSLLRVGGRWKIDDVAFADGARLSDLLAE